MKINSNTEKIEEFLTRGVENIYPNKEFVEKKLKSGERLTMYLGIDPTGPTLHLGHVIILKKLKAFQELGHQVILLIGDFTAMIGDPTDKTAVRKRLTAKEVLANAKLYKKQASTFLNFSGKNKAFLKYNSKWLAKMRFAEVLDLATHMTVEQMLKRDMFDRRIKEGKPIYIHEFLYPLLQGYDSVALGVDGEIGGNDQTFNMIAGRHLSKQILNKEKFVITMKLLADESGKKMGKTEGNVLSLTDSASEMFGKVMSWTDGMILPAYSFATDISESAIADIKTKLEKGENPKEIKMLLALEITKQYHGMNEAELARDNFQKTFAGGGIPLDAEEATVKKGVYLYDVLALKKLVQSKSELRRLLDEGAVAEVSGEKIKNFDFILEKDMDIKIGKRRFLKIKVIL